MVRALACGVVGAGVFGGYHAHQYARREDARLVGVYDPDAARARALADAADASAFATLGALLDAAEAVSVCTPASTHAATAGAALARGVAAYVEKPMATTLEDADDLLAAAAKGKAVLAVGHQERLVIRALGLLDAPERPLRIEAVRRSPYSPRGTDVSCVLDMMIHDLDLALYLNAAEPLAVEAEGEARHGPHADAVRAEATFADGMVARFDASRIAAERGRTMRLVYPSGEVAVDFIARTLSSTARFPLNAAFAETAEGRDPLGASLAAFLAAARGEGRPAADGHDGARALDLALAVEHAAQA